MADDDYHKHPVQDGDATGELPHIHTWILFPALGVPCVVDKTGKQYIEVVFAAKQGPRLSIGAIQHYLRVRPFQRDYGEPDTATLPPLDIMDIYHSDFDHPWSLADLHDGKAEERATHHGAEDNPVATVELTQPIFPLDCCRLAGQIYDKLKVDYKDVHRVLLKAGSTFSDNTAYELVWISEEPRSDLQDYLYQASLGGRPGGRTFQSSRYRSFAMRHPVLCTAGPVTKFAHLTDIHNSTAHNLLNLSNCRVLEDPPTPEYSPVIGKRFNNYNRNFSYLVQQAESCADVLVCTGDLVDYGRGIHVTDPALDPLMTACGGNSDAGDVVVDRGSSSTVAAVDAARSILPQATIWRELGGDDRVAGYAEQANYTYDANFTYFIQTRLLPRYYANKPVFTSMGNHDFHPNPFTPWPTGSGDPDPVSYNPATPSDYNLTRYEACLAYGPNCYRAYPGSNVGFIIFDDRSGPGGLVSTPECGALYFYFINPFLDYAVTFGRCGMVLFDFGREEVKPRDGKGTNLLFWVPLCLLLLGILAMALALGFLHGAWQTGFLVAGAIAAALGLAAMALLWPGAVRSGQFAGEFEDLENLPGAKNALSSAQQTILDKFTARDCSLRAMFCHALVVGRPPRFISVRQINAASPDDNLRKADHMRYGVLADGAGKVIDCLRAGKLHVTLSGHSHYTTVYKVEGTHVSARWPADVGGGAAVDPALALGVEPGALVCVTAATGPMAELNRDQVGAVDGATAKASDRQLRDSPSATLVTLDGGVRVERLPCALDSARPRRAAFDSWKGRFDHLVEPVVTVSSGNETTVSLSFCYLSDATIEERATAMPLWPSDLAAIVFFVEGRAMRYELRSWGPHPVDGQWNHPGYSVHQFDLDIPTAEYQTIKRVANQRPRLTVALEYPGGEDPWLFDVKRKVVTMIDDQPEWAFECIDFPDFSTRNYTQPFAARSPTS